MTNKKNHRKRNVSLGILAALVLALGIWRCADEDPAPALEEPGTEDIYPFATDKMELAASDTMNSHPTIQPAADRRTRHRQRAVSPAIKDTVRVQRQETAGTDNVPPSSEGLQDATPTELDSPAPEESLTAPKPARFPHAHLFRVGIRAGAGYSMITGLGSIVEGYNVRPKFTMDETGSFFPRIGFFGTWQYGRLGAEATLDYMRPASKTTQYKHTQGVAETTRFHHHFITPQLLLRFYAFPMFYMGAGISVAMPLGSNNIDFSTDDTGLSAHQQAERRQEHLRETLKFRTLFSPTIKLGYANPRNGLELGLEYGFGINDLLHTLPNDYGYGERKNNLHYVSFTVGSSLSLNQNKKLP